MNHRLKICVLYDPLEGAFDPSPYMNGHHWEVAKILKATVEPQIRALAEKDFDLYLNLCDGSWDADDDPGIEVVQLLEELNLAYTGASSDFYDPSRDEMKRACAHCGIAAPAGVVVSSLEGLEKEIAGLRYPLLVKHANSYASIGITPESRVETFEQLQVQVQRNIDRFGRALVEEFIDGREFSVLVAENPDDPDRPVAFLPVEFIFPPGESFKHETMKWIRYREMTCVPVRSEELIRQMQKMAVNLFKELKGNGYGRCDIRMDKHGHLYMLEINPNCGILYDPSEPGTADLILQYDSRGHKTFLDLIFRSALERQKRRVMR